MSTHRRRRLHARRRHRLDDAEVRSRVRQPRGGRRRHRRRTARSRQRDRERRSALGAARRRRQLRHRHAVRVRPASARADDLRGTDLLPGRRRPRSAARVPRLGRRRPGRDHRGCQPHDRAAAAGDPGGVARQEGRRVHRRLDRADRRGRSARQRRPRRGRADRRPARPDALPRDPDAARPAVAEGDPRLLQGDQPRAAR